MSDETRQFLIVAVAVVLIAMSITTCTIVRGFKTGTAPYCAECTAECAE